MSLLAGAPPPSSFQRLGRLATSSAVRPRHRFSRRRGFSSSSSGGGGLLAWYVKKLETHPILTKSLTSGVIAGAGDLICQTLTDKPAMELELKSRKESGDADEKEQVALTDWWNWARTLNFAILGTVMVGPALHYWYGGLAARFPLKEGASSVKAVLTRVSLDQFVFTPLFVPCWIAALWTMDGYNEGTAVQTTLEGMPRRMKETVPEIIVHNWMLWFPIQCINFFWTPVQFQVLISNCVALVWNAYLSFSTKKEIVEIAVEAEQEGHPPDTEQVKSNLFRRMSTAR